MSTEIKIFQCNIQSMEKNKDELSRQMIVGKYDIALLSETWSKEIQVKKYNISNHFTFLDSRDDGYGGAAIIIKKEYKSREYKLPKFDCIQCVAREIVNPNILVVSIYISPNINTTDLKNNLKQIFDRLKQHRKTIIGGDFNAHHFVWDKRKTDRKGSIIMDIVNDTEFLILNEGQVTFVPAELNKQPTAIDLVLTSAALYQDSTMQVLDYSIGSRHLVIATTITIQEKRKTEYFINKKKIKENVAKINVDTVENINDIQCQIQKIIKKAKQKNKHEPKFWWSDEVEIAWNTKNEARAKFNKNSGLAELIELKKAEGKFTRLKKIAAQNKFREFASSIDPTTPSRVIWNDIKRLTGRNKCKKENILVHEDKTLAVNFMDKYFPIEEIDVSKTQYSTFRDILNIEKWDAFLSKKKKPSAAGSDGISYEIMKIIPKKLQNLMIKELNDIWKTGMIPESMKTIKVIAIPKPGKCPETIDGVRPLSMINCLSKTLNAAVLTEYQDFLENKKLLPTLSFGFRKKRSTTDCLNFVSNEIYRIKRAGKVAAAIFVDLTNAFNTVQIDKLEEILYEQRTPQEYISYFSAFLRKRKIKFQVGQEYIERTISNGLPQGDVLSPTLFNMYTSSLHEIKVEGVTLVQYADDFGVLIEGKNLEEVKQRAQIFIDKFALETRRLNFDINPSKTKSIIFQANNKDLDVVIRGEQIETVNHHRYLGILIDKYFRLGSHVRELKTKAIQRLDMIKVISGTRYGGHPETLNIIYNGLVRNFLEYGVTIYCSTTKTNLNFLNVINNQCLRRITGCTRSTPINTLHAIAAQQPMQFRRIYVVGKYLVKNRYRNSVVWHQLERNMDGPIDDSKRYSYMERMTQEHHQVFHNMTREVISQNNCNSVKVELDLSNEMWSKRITSKIVLKQLTLGLIHGKYAGRQIIYTDASWQQEECGIGIYHAESNTRLSLKLKNTVCIMSAELEAIHMALQFIKNSSISAAVIMTDSKSGLTLVKTAKQNNVRDEVIDSILQMARETETTLQWIPGHVNIKGNELADTLAKAALSQEETINNKMMIHDAVSYFTNLADEQMQHWYVNYTAELGKGRKFFALQTAIRKDPWHKKLQLNNEETRTLNRIFSGHDYSKYGLHKMNLENDCMCETCDQIEDAKHLILFCTKYENIRKKLDLDGIHSIQEIFEDKNTETMKKVTKFLKEIDKLI